VPEVTKSGFTTAVRRDGHVAPQNRLACDIFSLPRRRPQLCQLRDDYGFAPDMPVSPGVRL
jgi:hypothetical protein